MIKMYQNQSVHNGSVYWTADFNKIVYQNNLLLSKKVHSDLKFSTMIIFFRYKRQIIIFWRYYHIQNQWARFFATTDDTLKLISEDGYWFFGLGEKTGEFRILWLFSTFWSNLKQSTEISNTYRR